MLAITTSTKGVLRDVGTGRVVRTLAGHSIRVTAITFSPDQKWIATASWDHTVRLWDATTGKELAVLAGHKAALLSCAFSLDGRSLVTGSNDRTIKFWNLETLREVGSIQADSSLRSLGFSPNGQILLGEFVDAGKDSGLRCWRAPSLAEIDAAEAKGQAAIKSP